ATAQHLSRSTPRMIVLATTAGNGVVAARARCYNAPHAGVSPPRPARDPGRRPDPPVARAEAAGAARRDAAPRGAVRLEATTDRRRVGRGRAGDGDELAREPDLASPAGAREGRRRHAIPWVCSRRRAGAGRRPPAGAASEPR